MILWTIHYGLKWYEPWYKSSLQTYQMLKYQRSDAGPMLIFKPKLKVVQRLNSKYWKDSDQSSDQSRSNSLKFLYEALQCSRTLVIQ